MTIAYVVPVHRNPAQVLRLLKRLQSDHATAYVHVDARAPRAVFEEVARGVRDLDGVELLERVPVRWGGPGLVHVCLLALERLLSRDVPFEHVVYVTGQDYPLVPAPAIERFFAAAPGRSFTSWFPLPGVWPRGGLDRFERWHLVSRVVLHLPLPWRRRIPGGRAPFGGGAHWALARDAAEHVREVARREPRLVRFFDHVLHAEELFLQTILLNSPLAGTVVNDNLRYLDWSVEPGPKILTVDDLPAMRASGALFARKFDAAVDARVLDELDRLLDAG